MSDVQNAMDEATPYSSTHQTILGNVKTHDEIVIEEAIKGNKSAIIVHLNGRWDIDTLIEALNQFHKLNDAYDTVIIDLKDQAGSPQGIIRAARNSMLQGVLLKRLILVSADPLSQILADLITKTIMHKEAPTKVRTMEEAMQLIRSKVTA
jgi:hypothetical protein